MSADAPYRFNRNNSEVSTTLADLYLSSYILNELDKLEMQDIPYPILICHYQMIQRAFLQEIGFY